MAKICYVRKKFKAGSLEIIEKANEILEDYEAQGDDLTLRQLYYQFVARGYIDNKQTEYSRLGGIINDARLAGLIDWDRIVDRTRYVRRLSSWEHPRDVINSAASSFHLDRWANQDYRPEVWIEKDALVGVIERVCNRYDVPFFSCRGYTSQSELWAAGRRLASYYDSGKLPVVFHLGDHDPSGIDMTRDITGRLAMFSELDIDVQRLALHMSQVRQYNPPPNPAKDTDSRFAEYIKIYGDESWELDALEPSVIRELIEGQITALIDQSKWLEVEDKESGIKATIRTVARNWGAVEGYVSTK